MNLSFGEAEAPAKFKQGTLTPELKKPSLDSELFPCFSPISNLRFISNSKATEKVVAARLNSYLDDNNLHELLQSAYKQAHSTETALVQVQNDVLRSIEERKCVALLLLDLSAAFDTVDHSILLPRLRHRFGTDGKVLKWLHLYLTNRSQFLCVENGYSSGRDLFYGVPQGSVLGPILYLLYTAPLADVIKEHDIAYHFYADYTQIYMSFQASNYIITLDEVRSTMDDG